MDRLSSAWLCLVAAHIEFQTLWNKWKLVNDNDYGWMWASDYDWGWATFHYGRWVYDNFYGWLWMPGYEWSPAWVEWRSGGDYYGWAPLGPDFSFNSDYSF